MAALAHQRTSLQKKIHHAAQNKRVRFNEFFKDFDRLRTGEITESQFKRCINQSFGVTVSEIDFNQTKDIYGSNVNIGMINYREFLNGLHENERCFSRKSPTLTENVSQILEKLQSHYDFRGIILSDCFEDFDKTNSGLVTESQFWRCFPSIPDVLTHTEISEIIQTYRHRNTNLISYSKFQGDLDRIPPSGDNCGLRELRPVASPPPVTPARQKPVLKVLDKVQLHVYKDGIRTTEFFIDHDKLRSGFITKNQFIIGLNLICGNRCPLTREEGDKIAEYYIAKDGRVCYRDFCFLMENAFNVPHLEKNPTATVYRPHTGALAPTVHKLDPDDEEQVEKVLDILRDYVTRRRITMLYPFFKDFDRGKLFSRGVTKAQFRRLLNFFDVDLSDRDCELICKKFEESNGTDVNYPAFVQAIDKDYQEDSHVNEDKSSHLRAQSLSPLSPKLSPHLIDIQKLIHRLQCEVKVYRVRVCEHFKDFDGLKSGSISKSLFKRGLASMQGNHYNLTRSELEALSIYYTDPKTTGDVRWSDFERDMEKVITERNLEKKPDFRVRSNDHITLNSWNTESEISDEVRTRGKNAIQRMREQIAQRRIMTKPCFHDFDRHNCGYVSRNQFEQGLSYLRLESTEAERKAINAMYGDSKGINYHIFFNDLDPVKPEPRKYERNLSEMVQYIKFRETGTERLLKKDGCKTVEAVIEKIKETVMKRRIRILEFFKDYDKLKSGRILKSNFKRALDLSGLDLTVDEIDLLAMRYQSDCKEDCVYYHHFNDEIESIFTVKELEKSPTAPVVQYKIMPAWLKNNLSKPIQEVYNSAMEHLARFVKTRRMQLYPMFEDYDKCRNGTVTYSQFRRVLSILSLIADEVEFHALEKQYKVNVGGMNVFNYLAFCDDIYDIAKLNKLD
ncbi:uncharacterized protein LOC134824170 [Bolinopsis microptera]|uniref:uncharacterized protein LOC134824170 n=1 Tax=Bolinopsis microptera TaxID=2820187 RepID=UPI00307AA0F3